MSLYRLIYYSAMIAGWMAFLGWMIAEFALPERMTGRDFLWVALTGALVGAAIGAGLNLVAGSANAQFSQQLKRVAPGLLIGGVGGVCGIVIGNLLYVYLHIPLAFGWMVMGAGIGVAEGLYSRSTAKLRNGLIGGTIGGLIGGFLFEPIRNIIGSSGMASRATGFVILGICIGALVSLVQVALKEAWLTVLDGYRPGRQLILSDGVTLLGKAEHVHLPFLGKGDAGLEPEHARIVREKGGRFAIEDNGSQLGVSVNRVRIHGRSPLADGDVIQIASNSIKFSERQKGAASATAKGPAPVQPSIPPIQPAKPQGGVVGPDARPAAGIPPLRPSAPSPPAPDARVAPPMPPAGAAKPTGNACPKCGKSVPQNQRYCIGCDHYF